MIAATDIRVDAGEPDLLDVLGSDVLTIRTGQRLAPEIVAEEAAAFIDRNRVPSCLHDGIARRVRQLDRIVDPADRTDRVPDADEVQPAIIGEGLLELAGGVEDFLHACGLP